jgi:hypothetical protein
VARSSARTQQIAMSMLPSATRAAWACEGSTQASTSSWATPAVRLVRSAGRQLPLGLRRGRVAKHLSRAVGEVPSPLHLRRASGSATAERHNHQRDQSRYAPGQHLRCSVTAAALAAHTSSETPAMISLLRPIALTAFRTRSSCQALTVPQSITTCSLGSASRSSGASHAGAWLDALRRPAAHAAS